MRYSVSFGFVLLLYLILTNPEKHPHFLADGNGCSPKMSESSQSLTSKAPYVQVKWEIHQIISPTVIMIYILPENATRSVTIIFKATG